MRYVRIVREMRGDSARGKAGKEGVNAKGKGERLEDRLGDSSSPVRGSRRMVVTCGAAGPRCRDSSSGDDLQPLARLFTDRHCNLPRLHGD